MNVQYLVKCGYVDSHELLDLSSWERTHAFFCTMQLKGIPRTLNVQNQLGIVRRRTCRHREVLVEWRGQLPLESMDVIHSDTGAIYG